MRVLLVGVQSLLAVKRVDFHVGYLVVPDGTIWAVSVTFKEELSV